MPSGAQPTTPIPGPATVAGQQRSGGLSWLYATCAIVVTAAVVYAVAVRQSDAQVQAMNAAVVKALAQLQEVEARQQAHHSQTGKFGWSYDIFPVSTATSDELDTRLHVRVEASADGQAYFAVADYSNEGGVECAAIVRNGDETLLTRAMQTGTWHLEANSLGECRKTAWPWGWLHWAGLGYIDVAKAIGSLRQYGM
jgi:hypothetical protein